MKQTLKSIFALLLVICMLATVAGCGKANNESTPANEDFFGDSQKEQENDDLYVEDEELDADAEDEADGEDKEDDVDVPDANKVGGKSWSDVLASMPKKLRGSSITVYNWNPATEYTGAPKVIDDFKKQTGITVKWQTISFDTYFTKLPAVIASGKNIPDVVRARGPIPEYMVSYQPLSTTNYDFSDEAWDKSIMDLYSVNGKSYATSLQNTHIGAVNVMFYNKTLIDKYDMEDPYKLWKKGKWDWNKYLEMCREYKKLTDNPGSCGEGWYWSYQGSYGVQGAIGFDGKKYFNNMKDKKFLTLHQTLCDLYNVEKLFAFGQESFFNEGKRLFSIGTSIHMRRKNAYFGNLKGEGTLYAVPMPEIKGQKYYQGIAEAEAYAVAKGAPNPEAVPYFLRYFLDGANYELSTYFCNKQNLEVYNWCMSHKNKFFVYVYPEAIKAVDQTGIMGQTGAQVKKYIDENMGVIDNIVKDYNNTIKKITK